MIRRIFPLFILGAAAMGAATGPDEDGFLPEDARILSLAHLPAATKDAALPWTVRLAPSGKAMVLYGGRLVALAEQTDAPLSDWNPPSDAEAIRDFCWLDGSTLALLRDTSLDFIRDGKPVRGVTLPGRGMRLARADGGHCYVFGGASGARHHEVLLFGVDGKVRNLIRVPEPVTAVAGDGSNTFVAVGPVVYFLTKESAPRPVFRERTDITDLAYAAPVGVFYLTEDGVGCMIEPASGLIFLRREVTSLDCRGERLLLLTRDREILLVNPISALPHVITEVSKFATEGQKAGAAPLQHRDG